MPDSPYHELAMTLLPVGSRPSIVDLRAQIAAAVEKEVKRAMAWQLRESIPVDVAEIQESLKVAAQDLVDRRNALDAERAAFKRVVAGHIELLEAVEHWMEWVDGEGSHEEREVRWEAVKRGLANYQNLVQEHTDG